MICARCAGTESGLGIRSDGVRRVLAGKNLKDGAGCARCDGAGQIATIAASCSHCGASILSWRPCPECSDSKAYKAPQVKSAQASSVYLPR